MIRRSKSRKPKSRRSKSRKPKSHRPKSRRSKSRRSKSRKPKSRRPKSRRPKSRRQKRSNKFGAEVKIELADGTEVKLEQVKDENNKKYKEYLEKVSEKLHKVNQRIKDNHLAISVGSFLLLLFFVVYTSYTDIKDKSAKELMYSVYNYLIGGSLLGQYALKDSFYELIAKTKNVFKYDYEFNEIKNKFNELKNKNLLKPDMIELFNTLEDDYNYITKDRVLSTSKEQSENLKSFMKLIFELAENKEKNKPVPELEITNLITKLDTFINNYGDASKRLDEELVNPLLLNLIGKEGPPISAIFLVGNPGVGKTTFVNKFAETLGAKVYDYKPEEHDIRRGGNFNYNTKNAKEIVFSVFVQMVRENTNNKPMILFIDEIDKKISDADDNYLLTTLLNLLGDSKERSYKDNILNTNLQLPKNLIIICASNTSLNQIAEDDTKYKPLISRFVQIFIPNMSKELQLSATIDYLKKIYPDNLTDDDKKFIKDVIDRTNFSGMRELLTISNTYVTQLKALEALSKFKKVESIKDYRENYLNLLNTTASEINKETVLSKY